MALADGGVGGGGGVLTIWWVGPGGTNGCFLPLGVPYK